MNASVLTAVLVGWLVMAAVMLLLWVVQQRHKDAGIVDVGWAAGLGVLGILYAVLTAGHGPRQWLVAGLICVWSWRLASYLLRDRVLGAEEDGRYRTLREKWAERAARNFFIFFQVQASWSVLFSLPVLVAMTNPQPQLGPLDYVGAVLAILAIAGESAADRQLARFRADPANRGKTCRSGLWRYSRHPNYFFEWLHWWAYVLIGVGHPYWWLTLLGPALMLLFLFKITGIPYTEAQALRSRGDDYREYQRTTSVFIPWFPKED